MKLKLVLRDVEYRKALMKALGRASGELYLETGRDFRQDDRTMILTDVVRDYPGNGFICLSPDRSGSQQEGSGPYTLFKYEKISVLLSQIRFCYYLWTGEGEMPAGTQQLTAICCDGRPERCTDYAKALARELIYRKGGKVLLLSMSYVNSYGVTGTEDGNTLRRLLYYLEKGRDIPIDSFFVRDRYDLYTFRAPYGRNPIAYMAEEELLELLRNLAERFDTVLLDFGNCYSPANLKALHKCRHRIRLADDPDAGLFRDLLQEAEYDVIPAGKDWELTLSDQVEKLTCDVHRRGDQAR